MNAGEVTHQNGTLSIKSSSIGGNGFADGGGADGGADDAEDGGASGASPGQYVISGVSTRSMTLRSW